MKEQTSTEKLVKTAQALREKGMTFSAIAKEMRKQKMTNTWGNPVSQYNAQNYVGAGTKAGDVEKKPTFHSVSFTTSVTPDSETLELITAVVSTSLPPERKLSAIRKFMQ